MMRHKILAVLMLFVLVFATANSYGQTTPTSKQIQVFVQIQIRNSQGQLVAYLEPTVLKYGSADVINHFVDTKPKNLIIKDGKKFEQIQFEERGIFNRKLVMSQYHLVDISNSSGLVLTLKNDGFPVQPNDSYHIWWTILVPTY